jgi:hypothetical protein
LQRARELHEEPVADGVDLAPAMLEKNGPELALMLGQQIERQRLVALRQGAVADHVGEHDGCELAFGAFRRHRPCSPPIRRARPSIVTGLLPRTLSV